MAESVDTNPVSVSTVKKTVFVSLLERNRPVEFMGELTIATKETFRNLLGNKDPDIFFQLRDKDWGGLFVDASKIPDRSVLKAVVVKSDLVSFKYAQSFMCVWCVLVKKSYTSHTLKCSLILVTYCSRNKRELTNRKLMLQLRKYA